MIHICFYTEFNIRTVFGKDLRIVIFILKHFNQFERYSKAILKSRKLHDFC